MSIGQRIRKARIDQGIGLRKFAEMIGISPTYLSMVERGICAVPPTPVRLARMAKLLGENLDEFCACGGRVSPDITDRWIGDHKFRSAVRKLMNADR